LVAASEKSVGNNIFFILYHVRSYSLKFNHSKNKLT
jgi:hypothetical protein